MSMVLACTGGSFLILGRRMSRSGSSPFGAFLSWIGLRVVSCSGLLAVKLPQMLPLKKAREEGQRERETGREGNRLQPRDEAGARTSTLG